MNQVAESIDASRPTEANPLQAKIVAAIKKVYDPEIPVDIYELGLIYEIKINKMDVEVDMTLTAPGCPVAEDMPLWVQDAVLSVAEIERVKVNMVFDPPWDPSLMSDEARLVLGML